MSRGRWALVVAVGLLVAVVGFVGLSLGAMVWGDYRAYRTQVVPLLNYNLAIGTLKPLPGPSVPTLAPGELVPPVTPKP